MTLSTLVGQRLKCGLGLRVLASNELLGFSHYGCYTGRIRFFDDLYSRAELHQNLVQRFRRPSRRSGKLHHAHADLSQILVSRTEQFLNGSLLLQPLEDFVYTTSI